MEQAWLLPQILQHRLQLLHLLCNSEEFQGVSEEEGVRGVFPRLHQLYSAGFRRSGNIRSSVESSEKRDNAKESNFQRQQYRRKGIMPKSLVSRNINIREEGQCQGVQFLETLICEKRDGTMPRGKESVSRDINMPCSEEGQCQGVQFLCTLILYEERKMPRSLVSRDTNIPCSVVIVTWIYTHVTLTELSRLSEAF